MITCIKTYTVISGTHRWEGAPDHLKWLRCDHRHLFHIICAFEVTHDDRQIEIIEKQNEIYSYVQKSFEKNEAGVVFGKMSCEQIAKMIMKKFKCLKCEVLEDGMCGAIVLE